jgi:hypothetical protein
MPARTPLIALLPGLLVLGVALIALAPGALAAG